MPVVLCNSRCFHARQGDLNFWNAGAHKINYMNYFSNKGVDF
jgi:hypothetical protein